MLQRASQVSLMSHLVAGFDPVNVEGNYQSRASLGVAIYFGKVNGDLNTIKRIKKGIFALGGYCYGIDYPAQLNGMLEHMHQRLLLGLQANLLVSIRRVKLIFYAWYSRCFF